MHVEFCMHTAQSCISWCHLLTFPLPLVILFLWFPVIYHCLFTSLSLLLSALRCLSLPLLTLLPRAFPFIYLSTYLPVHTNVPLYVLFKPSVSPALSPLPLTLLSVFYASHGGAHLFIHLTFFSSSLLGLFRWCPQHFSPVRSPRPHHHRGHAWQQCHRTPPEHVPGALPVPAAE